MSLSIAGKTAIVTGSANGIGLAIARHFLDKGANVMFADIDEERLEDEIGAEARAEGAVRMFAGDLREKLTIANLLSATMDAFDRVDILVNASRQMALSDPLCVGDDAVEHLLQQNLITSDHTQGGRQTARDSAFGGRCHKRQIARPRNGQKNNDGQHESAEISNASKRAQHVHPR